MPAASCATPISGTSLPTGADGEAPPNTTLDAFLDGAFHLLQPAANGFRAGHDALLVAAAVPGDAAGQAVDLGAGAGALAFAAAVRAPGLHITLAERNAAMAALAERSRRLPGNAALAPRLRIAECDVLAGRAARERAGLHDGLFDLVLSNPPFHPPDHRRSPHALRDEALAAPDRNFLGRWLTAASALLRHGGTTLMILRPENLADIFPVLPGRLGDLRCLPIHPSAEAPATRILASATRGSRAPFRLLPRLVLDRELRDRVSHGEAHLSAALRR